MALKLPISIIGKEDILLLTRELGLLDEAMRQAELKGESLSAVLRKSGGEVAALNGLDVHKEADRLKLLEELESLKRGAPVVHISFAVEPPRAVLEKLTEWFRHEAHASVLIAVGLQPTIAAGCIVRTPNHSYDFSLRRHLEDNKKILTELIARP